jgi:hypothetical protein
MNDKKLVLVITWDHYNLVTQNFSAAISASIQGFNLNVKSISISQPIAPQLANIDMSTVSFVFCVGHEGLNININDKIIYDFFDCPFYVYILDTPIYNFRNSIGHLLIEYVNRSTKDNRLNILFAERTYLNLYSNYEFDGCKPNIGFMPFAAFPAITNKEEKIDRVVVIGGLGTELYTVHSDLLENLNYYNPYQVSQQQTNELIDTIEDIHFAGNATKHIVNIFQLEPKDLVDIDFLKFACEVDSYIKKRNRIRAIDSLKNFPTDFYGSGWDVKYGDVNNFRFLGEIKHTQISEIVSNYKVLLNFDPNWEDGVHDRVFTCLANQTNLITNQNLFLDEFEGKTNNIYRYHPNSPNINELAECSINEYQKSKTKSILLNHSWHARITALIKNI